MGFPSVLWSEAQGAKTIGCGTLTTTSYSSPETWEAVTVFILVDFSITRREAESRVSNSLTGFHGTSTLSLWFHPAIAFVAQRSREHLPERQAPELDQLTVSYGAFESGGNCIAKIRSKSRVGSLQRFFPGARNSTTTKTVWSVHRPRSTTSVICVVCSASKVSLGSSRLLGYTVGTFPLTTSHFGTHCSVVALNTIHHLLAIPIPLGNSCSKILDP